MQQRNYASRKAGQHRFREPLCEMLKPLKEREESARKRREIDE